MIIGANIQKPFDQRSILRNAAHMKDILAIILLGQVDIMQQLGEGN